MPAPLLGRLAGSLARGVVGGSGGGASGGAGQLVTIKTNIPQVQRWMQDLTAKQLQRVLRNTVNDIAFDGRGEEIKQIEKDIDRPTPFTKNPRAFRIVKASRRNFFVGAYVQIKDIQASYLRWQVYGGVNPAKRPSRGIPVGPQNNRNQYGNTPGYRSFIKNRRNKKSFFIVNPGDNSKLPPGVYRRYKRKGPKLVMSLVPKTRYRRRYRWSKGYERYAKKNAQRVFVRNFARVKNGPRR